MYSVSEEFEDGNHEMDDDCGGEDVEEPSLKFCTVTVLQNGTSSIEYRWSDADVNGSDMIEEDVSDWEDEDILEYVCSVVGINDEERMKIKIDYE